MTEPAETSRSAARSPAWQWLATAAFALLAIGVMIAWALQGRAQHPPDAPQGKLACVSYTPRSGTIGVDPATVRAHVETDIAQLAGKTRCVRTYSVLEGLDHVPAVARKHGLRIILGIWIGRDERINEQGITRAIALAQENKDIIDAIVVGNEVLLRREQKPETLMTMLTRVREATGLPVTYADVWDFWLQNPQLATAVSFVTVHILPYWEDDPIGIEHALSHVNSIYERVQKVFPDKRIFVGETGWPSAGRQREAAVPSLLNQARFFREFVSHAETRGLPYNFIEAYDQPWKRRLEGTVGGYWGVLDQDGREKFPLTGPVIEDPRWWRGLLAAFAGGAVALLTAQLCGWAPALRAKALWFAAGLGAGALIPMQWTYLWQSNRTPLEWTATLAWCLSGYLVLWLNLRRLSAGAGTRTAGTAERYLLLAFLLGVAYIHTGLSFDARYRGFPTIFAMLPVLALVLQGLRDFADRTRQILSIEELVLAWLILLSVPWIVWNETLANASALHWCVWSLLLALTLLAHFHVLPREHQRADQQT